MTIVNEIGKQVEPPPQMKQTIFSAADIVSCCILLLETTADIKQCWRFYIVDQDSGQLQIYRKKGYITLRIM